MSTDLLSNPFLNRSAAQKAQLVGRGLALPPLRVCQSEILEFVLSNFKLKDSSRHLYQKFLSHPSIEYRNFALDSLEDILNRSLDEVNQHFEKWSVRLSTESLKKGIHEAGLKPNQLDFLAVTTCTGYLCPGIGSHLVEKAGLKESIKVAEIAGMGCGALIPALELAANYVRSHPNSCAAVVSTEISSSAFFQNESPDIILSNSIFSDGSGALILKSPHHDGVSAGTEDSFNETPIPIIRGIESATIPKWRDQIRFRTQDGYLRNVLGKNISNQISLSLGPVVNRLLKTNGLTKSNISHWIFHSGGEKILLKIQNQLKLSEKQIQSSVRVLKKHGNMSSPSVLFSLEEEEKINPPRKGNWGVLTSYGAGLSIHAVLLEYQ